MVWRAGCSETYGHAIGMGCKAFDLCFSFPLSWPHLFAVEVGMIETYRGMVSQSQLDHMGHMNVQWYTAKFDEATWQLFSHLGITGAYIRDQQRGMFAVEQWIQYKAEALAGDLLIVHSCVREMTEKAIKFQHVMTNLETGTELAICRLTGVHVDRTVRKACPFPEAIFQRAMAMIEPSN